MCGIKRNKCKPNRTLSLSEIDNYNPQGLYTAEYEPQALEVVNVR